MPSYLVERYFPGGFAAFLSGTSADAIAGAHDDSGAVWLRSFIAQDDRHVYCVCEAPSPEVIRRISARVGLPVDTIRRVTVLLPHAYPVNPPAPR